MAEEVGSVSKGYAESLEDWRMIHDVKGGTRSMRAAGKKWLPQEPKEQPLQYAVRLERSFMHPGYNEMTSRLTGAPFTKPVSIKGKIPEKLQPLEKDVDRQGTSLTQFAKNLLVTAVDHGVGFILVDFPQVPPGATKADEEAMNARPFFILIDAMNLIGWQTRTDARTGVTRVTMIKIKECITEPDGEYGEKEVNYIRVYTESTWMVFREEKNVQNGKFTYTEVNKGTHTFGRVPLVTFYTNKTGFMCGKPAMADLAWLNIEHWQSASDQNNALRFARIGILFGCGFTTDDLKKYNKSGEESTIEIIGPNKAIFAENPEAKLGYVEHSGKAMGIGKDHLDTLERKMDAAGLQPILSRRSGNVTATSDVLDEARSSSDIQSWIRDEENAIEAAYKLAAQWAKVELPDDFSVDIFNEFTLTARAENELQVIVNARLAGEISRKTFLAELQRRGTLADYVNLDEEITKIGQEGPPLGLIPPSPTNKGTDDE